MRSLIMYQVEGAKDDSVVSGVFSKFCPCESEKVDGRIYLATKKAPDFCRLVGLANQDAASDDKSHLEDLADFMADPRYARKIDKFDKKCNKMERKIISAKKDVPAATQYGHTGMGGLGMMGGASISDLVEKAEQQQHEIQTDPRVARAQDKFDRYVDKNKTLAETKQFTKSSGFGGIISFGDAPKEKNIYDAIRTEKPHAEDYAAANNRMKEFLKELLNTAKEVSVMNITDGETKPDYLHKRKVKLDALSAEDFINMRNREMFVISL